MRFGERRGYRAAGVVMALLPVLAWAEEPPSPALWSDSDIRITPLVTLSNHGYLRLRYNVFHRMDLGAGGASGFQVPLDSTPRNAGLGESSSVIQSGNLRFRYEPSLRVGELLEVHARVDFLDDLEFGGTPGFGDVSAPFPFLSRTQVPPSDGRTGFRDAVRVKAAFGDLRLFHRIHFYGGRMPERFGLGIVRSDGSGLDSDHGDHVDALFFRVRLPAAAFRIGMEFPGEGAVAESPFRVAVDPHDPEQFDDVNRWVFVFESSPLEPDEVEARHKALREERRPVVDWGMYHSITRQGLSSERNDPSLANKFPDHCAGVTSGVPLDQDPSCIALTPRGAFFWTPSLWGRLLYRPRPDLALRLEAELAMVYGRINYTQSFLDAQKFDTKKRFFSVGAAFEFELDAGPHNVRLFSGVASGDGSSRRFGVLDGHTIAQPDDSAWRDEVRRDAAVAANTFVRSFAFNPDYRVDSILFREVIGAVTNAFYFKPAYHRVLLRSGSQVLGGGLSLLAAFATEPAGTPGGKRPLGVEVGADVFYRPSAALLVRADGAMLFPLSGLRLPEATGSPQPAAALRLMMTATF